MKVLWFTNIEMPAVRARMCRDAESSGGWMESLRTSLRSHVSVSLGMAAAGPSAFGAFAEDGVRYYHLAAPPELTGLAGIVRHWGHRLDDAGLLAQAREVIDEFGPDLIHVHGSERPYGLLAGMVTTPVLISLQGVLAACSRAYLKGIPATDVLRDVSSSEFAKGRGLVHAGWNMSKAARRESVILHECSYFAGRTAWDAEIVSAANPGAHYYHLEEVLRPEFYGPRWRPRAEGPLVVYTTGSPAPYKGLIYLLEAVALMRATVRPDVRLRIGGGVEGSEMWPVALRAVQRLGLDDAVQWLGPLSAAGIVAELMEASVFVHPSFVDNSPNSLAEAMIVGLPSVASAVGGIPSMVTDGRDGLLVKPGDVRGLAATVSALAADPARAAGLGREACRRATERHDPQAVGLSTMTIYDDVVASHALSRG